MNEIQKPRYKNKCIRSRKQIMLYQPWQNKIIKVMHKGLVFGNKILKRKQEEKILQAHHDRVKRVRPNTTSFQIEEVRVLNNGKRHMLLEDKYTEIQRQNRLLLEKITTTMNKKGVHNASNEKQKMNRSLNSNFRKKQIRQIEIENAKLLKRLQQKKSDYEVERMNEQWKKKKQIIKNLSNFPILKPRHASQYSHPFRNDYLFNFVHNKNNLSSNIQMMRIRNIDGVNMVVTVRLDQRKMTVIGDIKKGKEVKLIQIKRDQAIEFIQEECNGQIQLIFDRLKYDSVQQVLYLLGEGVSIQEDKPQGEQQGTPEQAVVQSPREEERLDF